MAVSQLASIDPWAGAWSSGWPLLRDTWLADAHADRIVRSRLRTTAAEWDRHARDPSYLFGGTLQQAAAGTAARAGADPVQHPPLSPAERDFLHASSRAHRRAVAHRRAAIAGLLSCHGPGARVRSRSARYGTGTVTRPWGSLPADPGVFACAPDSAMLGSG
jgi:hypothetical protein